MVRLERKAGAAFRLDFQDQQETEGVRLEGEARASFRMEHQGQKDAEARVVNRACVGTADSAASTEWPSGQTYLSGWSGQTS